jgi:hypothetical protein
MPKLVFLPSAQGLTETAWQQMLAYVSKGGTLLVTGPVNRDEHWMVVDRMGPLGVKAEVMPLAVRGSELTLDGKTLALGFPADVQQASAETMKFADGKTVEILPHGAGKMLWTADPVEFAEGYDASAALYRWAMGQADVAAVFKEVEPLSSAVLAFPTRLDDAEIYSFSNESMEAEPVDIVDAATGAHIRFTMEPQRGAALLLDLRGKVLASYGGAAEAR